MIRRRVVGVAVHTARVIGFLLIALAVLSMPMMRGITGHLAVSFTYISSLALGIVGVVWLIGVGVFLRFFDQFLSRN